MLPALHKVDPSLLGVGKGSFWASTQCGATEGMGHSWLGIIPCGNNSWWVFPPFPRLAGGLLPYAPTYSSWLDCWSQLHREVSAEAGMHWDAPGHGEELGGSPVGLGEATLDLVWPLHDHFPFPGQHEPREQPVLPQGSSREAICVGGAEVPLIPEMGVGAWSQRRALEAKESWRVMISIQFFKNHFLLRAEGAGVRVSVHGGFLGKGAGWSPAFPDLSRSLFPTSDTVEAVSTGDNPGHLVTQRASGTWGLSEVEGCVPGKSCWTLGRVLARPVQGAEESTAHLARGWHTQGGVESWEVGSHSCQGLSHTWGRLLHTWQGLLHT